MKRKGLGKGLGKGYKNIIPNYDSYIHSLSAKGIKLNAQKTLTGGQVSDEEVRKTLQSLEPKKEGKLDDEYKSKSETTKDRVEPVSRQIVADLKKENIPDVEDIILDDYGNYSAQVFIDIKSKPAVEGNYILGDYENLPDAKKFNLRKITNKINKVLKKHEGENIYIDYIEKPKRKYKYDKILPDEFIGYDKDYIKIVFNVI